MLPELCADRGCKQLKKNEKEDARANHRGCGKLDIHNWMIDIEETQNTTEFVEVRFKNTHKAYFRNVNNLRLEKGDIVAVEASPGHDIGIITLTGELVLLQMAKANVSKNPDEVKKIYRKAKPSDIDKWMEAIGLEHETMLRSRKIADDLKLNMKIGDVEYQGDKTKAIFYYIADDRVDFRQLIKVLAEEFRIRIEMRQIGARQEAGRIGGIGPCGRELCCASWMSKFVSVTTNSARYQEVSLNPQKLAGQCSKLKCCLNYEVDSYLDARKDFPNPDIKLETAEGFANHFKTDVYKREMWYIIPQNGGIINPVCLSVERVKEIIQMNRKGQKPEKLFDENYAPVKEVAEHTYKDILVDDSLNRFDEKKQKQNKRRKKRRKPNFKAKKQNNNAKK